MARIESGAATERVERLRPPASTDRPLRPAAPGFLPVVAVSNRGRTRPATGVRRTEVPRDGR